MKQLAAFILLCSPALAIDLPEECRVANRGPLCAWASLETLGNLHGIEQLKGLRDYRYTKRPNEKAFDPVVKAELERRGVRFAMTPNLSYNRSLLERYADSHGVMVALRPNSGWSIYCHAVVINHYDADKAGAVEFYCSDKRQSGGVKGTWKAPRVWFDRAWQGGSVVVFPDEEAAAE